MYVATPEYNVMISRQPFSDKYASLANQQSIVRLLSQAIFCYLYGSSFTILKLLFICIIIPACFV